MENTRTVSFQVPETLFQKIKDYLLRNNMTQKQFILGLIEQELTREQAERDSLSADREGFSEPDEEEPDEGETTAVDDFEAVCEESENEDATDEIDEDVSEEEDNGFRMQM